MLLTVNKSSKFNNGESGRTSRTSKTTQTNCHSGRIVAPGTKQFVNIAKFYTLF